MLSHAGDGTAKSCWQWRCGGGLAVAQYRCCVMLTMVLPSHAGDGVAEAAWPWSDVDAESCWRQCCRVMLVIA
jgi:hypothetical protein